MNNLQSLFPLGLLPDHTVIFPQLLQLCHIHVPVTARVFFHTLPSDPAARSCLIQQTLTIELQKGMCMCVRGGRGRKMEEIKGDCG